MNKGKRYHQPRNVKPMAEADPAPISVHCQSYMFIKPSDFFSVWVEIVALPDHPARRHTVVRAPHRWARLIGQRIDKVIIDLQTQGYEYHHCTY